MMSGAEIVQSSFDYDTSTIGPFKIPIKLTHVPSETVNNFQISAFYNAMVCDERALAVFNVNNYCLCVVTRNGAYQVPATNTPKLELTQWTFDHPLDIPVYEHIGYVKTYHKCLSISQLPTFLVRELGSDKAIGFSTKLTGNIVTSPPLSLYKQELIQTDADAVYVTSDGEVVLLYK